jgi:hypothetical protein
MIMVALFLGDSNDPVDRSNDRDGPTWGTRLRDATIKEECKRDYPHALQALWKALDRAETLVQN